MRLTIATIWLPLLLGLGLASLVGIAAARCGFPLPDERRRIGTIDGLRGYLALLVMVHHFAIWADMPVTGRWEDGPVMLLNNFGAGCVALFFMITGCLFFPKALGGRSTRWRSLYLSRAFRILPMSALVVLIASLAALLLRDPQSNPKLLQYPVRAAMWLVAYDQPILFGYERSALVNAMVLWSLKVEWLFYLVGLPLVALLCVAVGRQARLIVPLLLIMAGTVVHIAMPRWGQVALYAVFGYGMLGFVVRDSRWAALLRGSPAALLSGLALAAAMVWAPHPDDPLPLLAYFSLFACVACGNRYGGLLTTRSALVLGEASFGIYMLHGVVLFLAFEPNAAHLATWSVAERAWLLPLLMPIVALVAILLYLAVERPAISAGRRIARPGQPAAPERVGSAEIAAP